MRVLIVLMASVALVLGCSDDSTGGAAGMSGTGGTAGAGGDAGAGGAGPAIERTFVLVSPVPPCVETGQAEYGIEFTGNGITGFEGAFDGCSSVSGTTSATISCLQDQAVSYHYQIETLTGEFGDVQISGVFEACVGFLTAGFGGPTTTAAGEPLLDFYVAPDGPCEQGVPSDYTVELLNPVGPVEVPFDATASFEGCTGSIDSRRSTITCPNVESVLSYFIVVGDGDSQVSKSGQWDTCTSLLVPDTR